MNENYLIKDIGTQIINGERDSVNVTTSGEYRVTDTKTYIRYKEYDPDIPQRSYLSTIEVDKEGMVNVIREGAEESQLIFQNGRRHLCHYETPFCDLTIGVYTDFVENKLGAHGGTLNVSYSLDFNAELVSKNEIYVKVTEKEVE